MSSAAGGHTMSANPIRAAIPSKSSASPNHRTAHLLQDRVKNVVRCSLARSDQSDRHRFKS